MGPASVRNERAGTKSQDPTNVLKSCQQNLRLMFYYVVAHAFPLLLVVTTF